MSSQQFCLKWNNHTTNMLNVFEHLLSTEALVDVTLACDGLSLKAHKMVLSACSPFFQSLFLENPCKHPIVIMKDMSYKDLKAIIDFMYRGEVNVSQDQLSALLKTAETLKVKGLAEVTGENRQAAGVVQQEISNNTPQTNSVVQNSQQNNSQSMRPESPPMHGKRKRGRPRKRSLSDSNRSDDELVPSKIKEPESPEIEELSGDASLDGGDMIRSNSSSQSQVHQPSVNTFSSSSKHHSSAPSHQVNAQVDEPPSGDDNEFEVEPSKLLEQTLTTDNVPSNASSNIATSHFNLPSSSGIEISQVGLGDSQALVPVSSASDGLSSTHIQGPDSPQDIKPAILTFDEPPISPVAGPSHQSSDRSMMMYMDQSSMPGPSNYQDQSLVQHDSQPQDINIMEKQSQISFLSNMDITPKNKSRPFSCRYCTRGFRRESHLKKHLTEPSDNVFQIEVCKFLPRAAGSENKDTSNVKKRGRKPKLSSNTQGSHSLNIISEVEDSADAEKRVVGSVIKDSLNVKKRGRKPKLLLNTHGPLPLNVNSGVEDVSNIKKRGRKPKLLSNTQECLPLNINPVVGESSLSKKRGRKPKLQKKQESCLDISSAVVDSSNVNKRGGENLSSNTQGPHVEGNTISPPKNITTPVIHHISLLNDLEPDTNEGVENNIEAVESLQKENDASQKKVSTEIDCSTKSRSDSTDEGLKIPLAQTTPSMKTQSTNNNDGCSQNLIPSFIKESGGGLIGNDSTGTSVEKKNVTKRKISSPKMPGKRKILKKQETVAVAPSVEKPESSVSANVSAETDVRTIERSPSNKQNSPKTTATGEVGASLSEGSSHSVRNNELLIDSTKTIQSSLDKSQDHSASIEYDSEKILPFSKGWTRQIVRRSKSSTSDVYYFTPEGTKLRSTVEISKYLSSKNTGLTASNFTFKKKQIYVKPYEYVREARPFYGCSISVNRKKNLKPMNTRFKKTLKTSKPKQTHENEEATHRLAKPEVVRHLWNAIAVIHQQKQKATLSRIYQFVKRDYDISLEELEEQVNFAAVDSLIDVKKPTSFKGSSTDDEQKSYNIPKLMIKGFHDWYCFECHAGGKVIPCLMCFRVYHDSCCSSVRGKDDAAFVCSWCKEFQSNQVNQVDLNISLAHACAILTKKATELYKMRLVDEEEDRYDRLIFKKMAISTMEKKALDNEYNTVEEFQADAQLILHNSVIYHGAASKMATMASQMLKSCCSLVDEINECPSCYKSSVNKDAGSSFCQPCNPPHELVYAKQKGFSYWPAKVMSRTNDIYIVRFFGNIHYRVLVHRDYVKPITTNFQQLESKRSLLLNKAMDELKQHQQLLNPSSSGEKFTSTEIASSSGEKTKGQSSTLSSSFDTEFSYFSDDEHVSAISDISDDEVIDNVLAAEGSAMVNGESDRDYEGNKGMLDLDAEEFDDVETEASWSRQKDFDELVKSLRSDIADS